jgi:hypothetical protein
MENKLLGFWEYLERAGLVVMVLGFSALGWLTWQGREGDKEIVRRLSVVEQRLDSVVKLSPTGSQLPEGALCDTECVRQLVSEAVATISGITQPAKQEVVERVVEKVQTVSSSVPSSQYVPLGAGETTSKSWIDVPGAQVSFDIADLGSIKQVYFEAQLHNPTSGRVYARLWDKQAGHIIISSEIEHVAGDAKLVSTAVTIPTGGRTIQAQLRSENGQLVKLLSSRLRVDTK